MDQTQTKLDFFFKYLILAPLFSTALSNLHPAARSHHEKAKVHPLCTVEIQETMKAKSYDKAKDG